jgi:hypothetical protein
MRTSARLLFASLACLLGPATLLAQVKVTPLSATADGGDFYAGSSWGNLRGVKRVTTPLLNLTFVTNSGFLLAQRDAADLALPASLRLQGLRPADFQEIADTVHDALVAALTAQGVEVMPYDPVAVNPGFQELAHHAARTGREQPPPAGYETIAGLSGARQTVTAVGHHCPWIESFMLANYLPATRLTRELDATLPLISFLVEFVEYSTDRTVTYDWREFMPAPPAADVPRLRARPRIFISAGSAAFLTPDGQTAALTLTTSVGGGQSFAASLVRTRGRNRAERQGGNYEVTVDPAAYKQAVIALLKAQVEVIARKLAAGTP